MVLDVESKPSGQQAMCMSPFMLLKNKIREAVNKRATAAFESLQVRNKGLDELQATLEICEKLVNDLRYVHRYVKPCFPDGFKVFELFSINYEKIF